MLNMVPSTLRWKLTDRQPLETWIHPSGKVALLGGSCHPMLPYRAQGAVMAVSPCPPLSARDADPDAPQVEDGALIRNLFSRISHHSQLKPLLHAYETLRLTRTSKVQASSRLNQHIFHLPDGPEQVQRDAEMKQAMNGEEGVDNPSQWADRKNVLELFGYDADRAADEWWEARGAKEIGSLGEVTQARL